MGVEVEARVEAYVEVVASGEEVAGGVEAVGEAGFKVWVGEWFGAMVAV